MNYTETKKYIFSEIGKRIQQRKKEYKLTNYNLAGFDNKSDYDSYHKNPDGDNTEDRQLRYGKFDYSMISNISNGKAHPVKNPNLLSDSLLLHFTHALHCSSELELMWGDYNSDKFIKCIFEKLLIDVLWSEDTDTKELFNTILMDYVPYAEYHSYWQMFIVGDIKMPRLPDPKYVMSAYYYQLNEDEIFERYEKIQRNAIELLYTKLRKTIRMKINKFVTDDFKVEDGYSLKKLTKNLDALVSEFRELFSENTPSPESLGLRARNIIVSDYKIFGALILKDIQKKELQLKELNQKLLLEASLRYISELRKVQAIEIEAIHGHTFT